MSTVCTRAWKVGLLDLLQTLHKGTIRNNKKYKEEERIY